MLVGGGATLDFAGKTTNAGLSKIRVPRNPVVEHDFPWTYFHKIPLCFFPRSSCPWFFNGQIQSMPTHPTVPERFHSMEPYLGVPAIVSPGCVDRNFLRPHWAPLPLGRAASLSEGVTSDPPKLPAALLQAGENVPGTSSTYPHHSENLKSSALDKKEDFRTDNHWQWLIAVRKKHPNQWLLNPFIPIEIHQYPPINPTISPHPHLISLNHCFHWLNSYEDNWLCLSNCSTWSHIPSYYISRYHNRLYIPLFR